MRQFTCPEGSHHPSTNWARCRATALIETNALSLHQTANLCGVELHERKKSEELRELLGLELKLNVIVTTALILTCQSLM